MLVYCTLYMTHIDTYPLSFYIYYDVINIDILECYFTLEDPHCALRLN